MSSKRRNRRPARRDDRGKVHLVVHRDAAGRATGLSLSAPLFNDKWQNDVTLATASTTYGMLAGGRNLERAAELGRNAMAGTSKIADGALNRSSEHSSACRAGCSHCCYQAVGVSPPEVFAIHAHLVRTRSTEALAATVDRLRRADDATRGMSLAERLSPELPCPFLEDARCSIYEVRPLACRGKNSLDAAACERTLHDAQARAEFLAGTHAVPCFVEPIRAVHAVAAGLQLGLQELHGLTALPLELTAAMRVMLDDPDGVPARWLAGDDPFQAARGGDTTDDPRIRELSGRRA